MKKLNIVLALVLAVLIGFVIYFMVGAKLHAQSTTAAAMGWEYPEVFDSINGILASGSAPQQFQQLPKDTHNCTLLDITLTVQNRGMFSADWLDISVIPQEGDIAVYSLTGEGASIPAHSSGQVNLKLVTTSTQARHTIELNYYVYGMPRTIRVSA